MAQILGDDHLGFISLQLTRHTTISCMLPVSPLHLTSGKKQFNCTACLEEGHGNPRQQSCLENPMDRGAWWARVHRVAQSWTRLSDSAHTQFVIQPHRSQHSGSTMYIPTVPFLVRGSLALSSWCLPPLLLELHRGNHLSLQRRQWQPTSVLLPGGSRGRGSLGAAVQGAAQSRPRLSDLAAEAASLLCPFLPWFNSHGT